MLRASGLKFGAFCVFRAAGGNWGVSIWHATCIGKQLGFQREGIPFAMQKRMVRRFQPEQFWVSNRGENALLAGGSNGDSVPMAVDSKGGRAALAGSIQ